MTNPRQIKTAILLWEGRTIQVSYEPCWLGDEGIAHLEISCIEPPDAALPITETGYRSAFFHMALNDDFPGADFTAFTLLWLDEAASTKEWRRYVEANRQLSLF